MNSRPYFGVCFSVFDGVIMLSIFLVRSVLEAYMRDVRLSARVYMCL